MKKNSGVIYDLLPTLLVIYVVVAIIGVFIYRIFLNRKPNYWVIVAIGVGAGILYLAKKFVYIKRR